MYIIIKIWDNQFPHDVLLGHYSWTRIKINSEQRDKVKSDKFKMGLQPSTRGNYIYNCGDTVLNKSPDTK